MLTVCGRVCVLNYSVDKFHEPRLEKLDGTTTTSKIRGERVSGECMCECATAMAQRGCGDEHETTHKVSGCAAALGKAPNEKQAFNLRRTAYCSI